VIATPANVPSPSDLVERKYMPATEWAIASVGPADWVAVADYLAGLLERAPLRAGSGWAAHRLVLGCLVSELRLAATEAGEPADPPADVPPEWLLWERQVDHEIGLAARTDLPPRLTSDRAVAAPAGPAG
jgi:hypothetical protein